MKEEGQEFDVYTGRTQSCILTQCDRVSARLVKLKRALSILGLKRFAEV